MNALSLLKTIIITACSTWNFLQSQHSITSVGLHKTCTSHEWIHVHPSQIGLHSHYPCTGNPQHFLHQELHIPWSIRYLYSLQSTTVPYLTESLLDIEQTLSVLSSAVRPTLDLEPSWESKGIIYFLGTIPSLIIYPANK